MSGVQKSSESSYAATDPAWALLLRVRFDPPETEKEALREKDNIIEHLQRLGYDVEPMGLLHRG